MRKNTTGIVAHWKSLLRIHATARTHADKTSAKRRIESSTITNVVVFPARKVIYIKYPKNGGSSILRGIIDKKSSVVKYHYKDYPVQFQNWLKNMTDEKLHKEYFIFTIARNPYRRLESAFQYVYPDSKERSQKGTNEEE